jgi:sec-independent protein translocase protein TatB
MFGVDSSELAVVAILALIFIGPKDLPKVMRTVGYWVGRIRGMARHFTAGIENMVREAELEEMEKRWREENERIMSVHPPDSHYPEPGEPDEMPAVTDVHEPTLPFDETQKEEELPVEKRPLP